MLKYKCLVLDHDDTVVNTSLEVHYPSLKNTLAYLRPWQTVTAEEYMLSCFNPGFFEFMEHTLKFTEEETAIQLERWLKDVDEKIPSAYDGIGEIIFKQKKLGGLVAVVSHSHTRIIERDYQKNFGLLPDAIYGGEECKERRKPSVYPLKNICERFNLQPSDLVVVDDLKPGLDMTKAFGADFICAGWSHAFSEIKEYMQCHCERYASTVKELEELIF